MDAASSIPKLDSTYGAAFIGLVVSAILYGATILQTFLYYRSYWSKDSRRIKTLVFFVWLLDTLHLILSMVSLYEYLITNFNNPSTLFKPNWAMLAQTDVNGVIGLLVQCFFAHRVWKLSRSVIITVLIVALSLLYFALGFVFTIKTAIMTDLSEARNIIWVTATGIGAAAAADILIAGGMCYYLSASRSGFRRTDDLLTALIVYSLTTGLITSIVAVIAVIMFSIMPSNYVWLAFFWILGKCYVNSLLSALNSREALKAYGDRDRTPVFQLSQYSANSPTEITRQSIPPERGFGGRVSNFFLKGGHATSPKSPLAQPTSPTTPDFEFAPTKYPTLVVHVESRVSNDLNSKSETASPA